MKGKVYMTEIEEKIIRIAQKKYDECKQDEKSKKERVEKYNLYPHIFFLSCVIDSNSSDTAWGLLDDISKDLGNDFKYFYNAVINNDEKLNIHLKKVSAHRNDNWFKKAIIKIHNDYNDDISKLWKNSKNCAEVICKCLEFEGIGIKKATMLTNILTRSYYEDEKFSDKSSIDISPDVHVKRVMCKLGLINWDKEKDYKKVNNNLVIYKARAINPEFPGLLDLAFWKIGKDKICQNTICNKEKCPFETFCPQCGI